MGKPRDFSAWDKASFEDESDDEAEREKRVEEARRKLALSRKRDPGPAKAMAGVMLR
jgi:hypothetical protein